MQRLAGFSDTGTTPPWAHALDVLSSPVKGLAHRYPLVLVAASWLLGIFYSRWGLLPGELSFFWGVGVALALWIIGLSCARAWWISLPSFLLGIAALSAVYAHNRALPHEDDLSGIAVRKPQPIALRGIIASPASWSPASMNFYAVDESGLWVTRWQVQWVAIRQIDQWQPITARSELMVPQRLDHLLPGDEIQVWGSLKSIEGPTNPGGFDYASHARRRGVLSLVKTDDESQILMMGKTWRFLPSRIRAVVIRQVDGILHRCVTHGQAPLAAALVFGQREQVDWESRQQLMASGTLHMLAISGMHVEMIAGFVLLVCLLLSVRPRWTMVAIIGVCLLYATMAGGRPPVMRAVILVAAMSIGNFLGRRPTLFNLIGLAGLILLVLNPFHVEDVGVHLSFLAVTAIGIFHSSRFSAWQRRDALEELLEDRSSYMWRWLARFGRWVRAAARISFWVWLVTCPMIWHHFHVVSPVAVPLNVLLTAPLMLGLISGLLTGVLGWIPPIGWAAGMLTGTSLGAISGLVQLSCRLPLSHFWLPAPAHWWTLIFYAVLLIWIVFIGVTRYRGLMAVLLLTWLSVGVGQSVFGARGILGWPSNKFESAERHLRCTFLDVGHGTCVLIELPDGRVWMYDAGRLGNSTRSSMVIAPSLWQLSTSRIDLLVVSHADSDHYNAILGLLDRFRIDRVASTQRFWHSSSAGVQRLRSRLEQDRIPMLSWDQTTSVETGSNVSVEILHPSPDFRGESDNAESLCLQLEFAGVRILLTGDIEGSGLVALCEHPARRCQVMMAPHHGSLSHDSRPLMDWCQPEIIVISGGERAARDAVLRRYSSAEFLGVTFRDGATQIRIDSRGELAAVRWNGKQWVELKSTQRSEPDNAIFYQ